MTLGSRIDPDGAVVIRVVVHGPSGAGKTTTAVALGAKLGQDVITPEVDSIGRTVLFDWMEYVGGRWNGRPIRVQYLTVPGHDPRRCRHLLRRADVVIFVADTSPGGLDRSAPMLDELRVDLSTRTPRPGLIVQANRRDHPMAAPMEEVAVRLRLGPDDVVIETVATQGEGVRQAFVYSVRQGLRYLMACAGDVQGLSSREDEFDELLAIGAPPESPVPVKEPAPLDGPLDGPAVTGAGPAAVRINWELWRQLARYRRV